MFPRCFESQIVTGSFYCQQLRLCRDHLHRALEFFDCAERVPRAVNKECGRSQVREMLCALLFGTAWRMERVGEQHETCGHIGLFGAQHAGLPSAVGVTPEIDPPFAGVRFLL